MKCSLTFTYGDTVGKKDYLETKCASNKAHSKTKMTMTLTLGLEGESDAK